METKSENDLLLEKFAIAALPAVIQRAYANKWMGREGFYKMVAKETWAIAQAMQTRKNELSAGVYAAPKHDDERLERSNEE